MQILPLKIDDLTKEQKEVFFKDYPFEKFYTGNLQIDDDVFVNFLVDKLDKRIDSNPDIWQIRNNETLIAIFGLDKEIATSSNYGKNIYHLGSYYNYSPYAKEAFALINDHIELFCKENNVDSIRCKIDAEDHTNVGYLLSQHYHYYASSCKIYYDIYSLGLPKAVVKHKYKIRPYKDEDKNAALQILGQHKKNELYYNQDFPIENTTRIFEQYFLKQSSNEKVNALILEEVRKKKVVGVSMHTTPKYFNTWLTKPLVTWDLIVIDEEARGNGLGNLFFSHIMHEKKSDIELSTMSDNFQMLKFLHKLGFYKVGEFNFLYKKFTDK